jgi:hypothetical protein
MRPPSRCALDPPRAIRQVARRSEPSLRVSAGLILVFAALGASAAAGQTLTVSPSSIQFTYILGDPTPAVQSVTVTVPGAGAWSTFDESYFYDATPRCAFGLCASGSQTTLTPFVFALSAGTYTWPLTVRASGFTDVVVPVVLIVSSPAPPPGAETIAATPASITFTYTSGAALPAAQTVTVTVPGRGSWSPFDQTSAPSSRTGDPLQARARGAVRPAVWPLAGRENLVGRPPAFRRQ